MTAGLFELAMVVLVAAILGFVAKAFRQPLIVAYLATGAIIGYFNFFNIADQETFRVFSDLGIMFLLFLVGLEINYSSLRSVGKVSLAVGLGQILFTSLLGFVIAWLFGFDALPSLYIAVALTFSSTIIIVKLLSEKRDLNSLYGKISVGMLLVQDFVAILLLVLLAGFEHGSPREVTAGIAMTVMKSIGLFALILWIGKRVLPAIADKAAKSAELLFVMSLAWMFLLTAIAQRLGLSIEIGGFLAGLGLANATEHYQISARIRPLRDFFILVFFVILGSSFVLNADMAGLAAPVAVFSLFVLIGNPFIVLIIMGLMGYRKRTSFLTGLTVAQISEFSLVLVALGNRLGHVGNNVVSLVTAVGIVTITLSTYLILYADRIFPRITRLLAIFERKTTVEDGWRNREFKKPVILIGAHRTGQSIAMSVPKEQLLVIDFDPEIIAELVRHGYDYIFGDIADPEVLEQANFAAARLVISTSPDPEDNLALLTVASRFTPRPKIVVRADTEADARLLYVRGADYVILPNITAGQYFGKTVVLDPTLRVLEHLRQRDIAMLAKRHHFAITN